MSKGQKTKQDRKLRREVEILRAQLKSGGIIEAVTKESNNRKETKKGIVIDNSLIRKDLIKTLTLSAIAFSVILAIWIYGK